MPGTAQSFFVGKTPKVEIQEAPPIPTVGQERAKYVSTWRDPLYRIHSPAMRDHGEKILAWARLHDMKRILDFGAGKGILDLMLRQEGFRVHMIDIAENCLDRDVRESLDEDLTLEIACLWEMVGFDNSADGVVCIDVLEHLPMQHVPAVAKNIRESAPHGYCNAALFPHIVNGLDLHLTLKPARWWFQHFPDAECTVQKRGDMDTHAVMVW